MPTVKTMVTYTFTESDVKEIIADYILREMSQHVSTKDITIAVDMNSDDRGGGSWPVFRNIQAVVKPSKVDASAMYAPGTK